MSRQPCSFPLFFEGGGYWLDQERQKRNILIHASMFLKGKKSDICSTSKDLGLIGILIGIEVYETCIFYFQFECLCEFVSQKYLKFLISSHFLYQSNIGTDTFEKGLSCFYFLFLKYQQREISMSSYKFNTVFISL